MKEKVAMYYKNLVFIYWGEGGVLVTGLGSAVLSIVIILKGYHKEEDRFHEVLGFQGCVSVFYRRP